MRRLFALIPVLVLILTGCNTTPPVPALRYAPLADNTMALFRIGGAVDIGEFTGFSKREITCRGGTEIRPPDNKTYTQYIRDAFFDELRQAGIFRINAPVTLTGEVTKVDFTSGFVSGGEWIIIITLHSSNGRSITVMENYPFDTRWAGNVACFNVAQAFAPAVQGLIKGTINHPEFKDLLITNTTHLQNPGTTFHLDVFE